jgi:spermidine synthase
MKSAGVFLVLLLVACPLLLQGRSKVIYEKESRFNHIIVLEDDNGIRALMFDREGALQSKVLPGDPDHIELPYARGMPIGLAFTGDPKQVLIIGLGGGTIPGFLHAHFPKMTIDVVDIDPDVIEVAKKFFGFKEDESLQAYAEDGRKFIEKSTDRYDVVFLDAYGNDSIPYSLATREFLKAVRRVLSPTGIAVANVWSSVHNPLYFSMLRTYLEVFDELYVFNIEGSGNKILVAVPRKGKATKEEIVKRAREIVQKSNFPYDLADVASYGFTRVTEEPNSAPVLTDSNEEEVKKAIKAKESEKEPAGAR